ncbi:HNH endonuclease-domain-containing protein [Amylocarpus encephaloides]|uniref:HNH endonuclease-domain-containing protein n=1 Tax=Amylocarpus encephaloides TaxID=45428 RepID=A0A9P7YEG3_9HELO|nr:HNH endonuclease-domain-containing protein [Amylocarpus encephaloides]
MPPRDRSRGRNVHIYDAKDRATVLGDLILTNGVTNTNFYSMVEIIILFTSDFELRDEGDTKIDRNDDPFQPGILYQCYRIEPWLVRTISHDTRTRVKSFCDAIRSRDRRCVISGKRAVGAYRDDWTGFEAAHIFPLAYESYWREYSYDRWITIRQELGGTINSVQNGMLLNSAIHQLFDSYNLSINSDVWIIYVCLAGKYLDQEFLDDPQRPVHQLLRWHFRQAVLANMRGAGEPRFEHDFPPGSDIVGDILYGPKSVERMEFELFNRLAAQVEIVLLKYTIKQEAAG